CTRQPVQPVAVQAIEPVRCADYSFHVNPRAFLNRTDLSANHLRGRMILATWIDSPRPQNVQIHPPHVRPVLQWKLNGEPLRFDDHSLQKTDTGVAHAKLRKGKNLLMCALPETEHLWWMTINLWTDSPVTFS